MKLDMVKNRRRIFTVFGLALLLVAIFFIIPIIKLPPLCCKEWIQPFVTIAALLIAVLLFWVQLSVQYWARGDARDRRNSIFQVSLMTSWIYLAILFFFIALIIAIYSCSVHKNDISSWAVAFMLTSLSMTILMVLWQLLNNLSWMIYALRVRTPVILVKPLVDTEKMTNRYYLFLEFILTVCGLFLLSQSIAGITSNWSWWLGKSFISIALLCLIYQYYINIRMK